MNIFNIKKHLEVKRLLNLCIYEDYLFSCGYNLIAGVDEVGRGALAGPIVAAAVVLNRNKFFIDELNDSKKLDEKKRKKIFKLILKACKCWSVAKISARVIDKITLGTANKIVMKKAITKLKIKPDIIITDAFDINLRKTKIEVIPIINGDEISISIAAASIIAKVFRDKIMLKLDRIYPAYDFKNNKGYGTLKHINAIKKFGPCDLHRFSFKNVLH